MGADLRSPDTGDVLRGAVRAYVDAVCAGDLDAVVELFAVDAVVEDPVGYAARCFTGIEAIRGFYDQAIARGARLSIIGPVCTSYDRVAVVPLRVDTAFTALHCISVVRVDATGRIAHYAAHWGPSDIID